MKQYLVVKVMNTLSQAMELMALPGVYTLAGAQRFMADAIAAEPGSKFLIQEVGAA